MFGSQDDKPSPEQSGEKKSLFGWLRKKPEAAQVAAEQAQPAPTPEAPPAEPVATAPAAPVEASAPAAPAEVVVVPAAVEQAPATVTEPMSVAPAIVEPTDTAPPTVAVDETPRPAFSRFRINVGTEVTHPVHEQPVVTSRPVSDEDLYDAGVRLADLEFFGWIA